MSRLQRIGVALLASILVGVGIAAASQKENAFPHLKHERLFPVCEGCHVGVKTGVVSELYPAVADCGNCHDGTRAPRINYREPAKRASNLRFSHLRHDTLMSRTADSATCQSCHRPSTGTPTRMNVTGPQPASCIGCHAHKSDAHMSQKSVCSQCHVPLVAATSLTEARVAGIPRPDWHDAPDFAFKHGSVTNIATASCSTCHARQTCERCHANAARVPLIASLAPDARVASLERDKMPAYPLPESHRNAEWGRAHGATALAQGASCANCHTQTSCSTCHLAAQGTANRVIAVLPKPDAKMPLGGLRGVTLARARGVHPPDFAVRHGAEAASGTLQCTQCHSVKTCASCHTGMDSRAFHKPNFVERHAVEVFSGSGSCQSCHSTETFCRACHQQSGIASTRNMNSAFHTAQPMWILSHGQAARTGMESCASCHRQSDCIRCHSAVGGWRVNPHGPGFPAARLAQRNAASCRWCHSASGAPGG